MNIFNLTEVVKECSSGSAVEFTDSNYENIVAEWLRYASIRLARSKKAD